MIEQLVQKGEATHSIGKSKLMTGVSTLPDLEKDANDIGLVRVSRTCVMNVDHLKEIRQIRNSHLEAVMDNGEKLIVSRKYLPDIKKIFKRKTL